jgi:hypothetical protein
MSKQEFLALSPHVATILPQGFIDELRSMIDQTKEVIAATVNARLTMLYLHVGSRIRSEILKNEFLLRCFTGRYFLSSIAIMTCVRKFTRF